MGSLNRSLFGCMPWMVFLWCAARGRRNMAVDRNIMRRWFSELWTKGRTEIIDELVAPDCVIHGLMDEHGVQMKGPEPFKGFYHALRAQFGELRIDVEETLVDKGRVVARCLVRG